MQCSLLISHRLFRMPSSCWAQGVKLSDKERRDLEYKEQVYRLAVERKQQLGAVGWQRAGS